MRSLLLSSLSLLATFAPALAEPPPAFDDAPLRAVQFVDDREGWAVGDDGVIWHSIDGGKNWERQFSSIRASLRSVHFVSPWIGWIAGREELPGGASAGVVLYTRDGGVAWRRLLVHSLPALYLVRFVDEKTGYLAGDGSEQFPSGLFATTDGGKTWGPVPGSRAPSWRAGDFNHEGGALGGAWNRLATVRRAQVYVIDQDTLGGRNLCGLQLRGDGGVAVGEGGLVLLSSKSRGSTWNYTDLKLPAEVQASWNFHAVGGTGAHLWAVGRPGSAALHSPDGGRTWEVVRTGQTMPLHGLFFRDEKNGWAVGELGTIIATVDGGKTWQVQRRGGQHAAVLSVHARSDGNPLDTVALLGAAEGYLAAALWTTAPEPASAELARVGESSRCAGAWRLAGGAMAESLWQFPVPSHLATAERDSLLAAWNKLHGGTAAEQLMRQIVLAIRIYRPEVLLTDCPENSSGADSLTAEAVAEAFRQAADPRAFPEQITSLGLEAHQAKKLYGVSKNGTGAHVHHDLTEINDRLGSTVREFSAAPIALLSSEHPPAQRHFRLLADHLPGSAAHRELMQGIYLAPGGLARRSLPAAEEMSPSAIKAVRTRANLWAIADAPTTEMTSPERLLAQIGPALAEMPDNAGARVAVGLARLYAEKGQWDLAREAHALMIERYPTHPLAIESYRWLLMHQSSSEARHRHEQGQFVIVERVAAGQVGATQKPLKMASPFLKPKKQEKSEEKTATPNPAAADKKPETRGKHKVERKVEDVPTFETKSDRQLAYLSNHDEILRWYQGCIKLQEKLQAFGPLHGEEPVIGFCVQSARRHLGEMQPALQWYRDFAARTHEGPWRRCALAELWLVNRTGEAPKSVLYCRSTDSRPYLDGKLDDPCWAGAKPVRLQAVMDEQSRRDLARSGGRPGEEANLPEIEKRYPTEVRMAHDVDFLYIAVRCGHPAGQSVEAAKVRTRDQDMRKNDRVSIMLDLDRDYATCFHLQVDQRGCVLEDCWGDKTWNPRWFVAIHREPTSWTAEIAIPRSTLTCDHITAGNAWAANFVRVLPGQGVLAFSLPAEAPEVALRPEGMGLILFASDTERVEAKQAVPRR
jgi:photosystem II stability/assembly factor-like uncharacterized protein